MIKTALVFLMGIVYSLYIQLSHIEIFTCYDERVSSSIPQHTITLLRIVLFMIAVLTHGRQVEWTARLDFLWQLQASHEKREMAVLQESNRRILYNLLPAHVAKHFLDNQFRGGGNNISGNPPGGNTIGQDLYHQSYTKVGVMFCSIPNFHEFYTELDGNQLGVECLRLLNEIIADFDNLLAQERFVSIDKIKTVGSTYMAAVGLIPGTYIMHFNSVDVEGVFLVTYKSFFLIIVFIDYKMTGNDNHLTRRHMTTLFEFARAMRASIQNINENSYNNFATRIGKCIQLYSLEWWLSFNHLHRHHFKKKIKLIFGSGILGINIGPVVAGVIGARKPQYDIWGNTVNVSNLFKFHYKFKYCSFIILIFPLQLNCCRLPVEWTQLAYPAKSSALKK